MKKLIFFIVVIFFSSSSFATKIKPTPINELIDKSDYVLIGTVKEIKLFNEKGKEKRWFGLVTGPGIENTLYYYIEIDKEHILKGSSALVPNTYKAEAWKMWHKELKSERELYLGKQVVLFLKGNNLEPTSLPEYIHRIYKPEILAEIEEAVKKSKN
jgi:hypothetical protein